MDALTTSQIVKIQRNQNKYQPFWLSMFFPFEMTFATEEVEIQKAYDRNVPAPYCVPEVEGKFAHERGFKGLSLTPPYVKAKRFINPRKNYKRSVGEPLGGTLTPTQRRQKAIGDAVMDNEKEIMITEELQGFNAVVYGKFTAKGENHPTMLVDFERRPENTITVASGSCWSDQDSETYDPAPDLKAWAMFSRGYVGMAVFTPAAWADFVNFKRVRDLTKTDSGSLTEIELACKDMGKVVEYGGKFGELQCWIYHGTVYNPTSGEEETIFNGKKVLLSPRAVDGTRLYGGIIDAEINANGVFEAKRAPKHYIKTGDASREEVLNQSAPLMAIPEADLFVLVDFEK